MNAEEIAVLVPEKKKRAWWVYVLVGLGVLVCLAVVGVLGVFLYAKSLVRNYTAAGPTPVPKVEFDKQRLKEMQAKWVEFAQAVQKRQSPAPFIITADDINLFVGQNKQASQMMGFVITNNQLQAKISAPLDQAAHMPQLKGRYFNGTATLNIGFHDGWLTPGVSSLQANGQPVPGWLLKRIQQQSLLPGLDRNQGMVNLLHEIESIRIQDNQIVVTPLPPMK